jgi:hypothetical protein
MNEQQMRKVLDWFRHHIGPITCSVCSQTDFKIDSELTTLPVWRIGPPSGVNFADGVPAVMVTCSHCASVRLFSAAKMGLFPAAMRPAGEPTHSPDEASASGT